MFLKKTGNSLSILAKTALNFALLENQKLKMAERHLTHGARLRLWSCARLIVSTYAAAHRYLQAHVFAINPGPKKLIRRNKPFWEETTSRDGCRLSDTSTFSDNPRRCLGATSFLIGVPTGPAENFTRPIALKALSTLKRRKGMFKIMNTMPESVTKVVSPELVRTQ